MDTAVADRGAHTGRYVMDRETGRLVRVSLRPPDKSDSSWQTTPFAKQVLQGYQNAHQRGHTRSGWKAETIKRVWGR